MSAKGCGEGPLRLGAEANIRATRAKLFINED